MSLITTPGAATANSFASIDELDAYAAARRPAVAWLATATDDTKEAALLAAARELDACFAWTGTAVDGVQALTWPRAGMLSRNGYAVPTSGATSIPRQLKDAQCEFALQLGASDRLGDNEALQKGVTSVNAGDVAVTFTDAHSAAANIEGADVAIRKQQADLYYVSDVVPAEVRRLLVPSWFTAASVRRQPFMSAFGGGD